MPVRARTRFAWNYAGRGYRRDVHAFGSSPSFREALGAVQVRPAGIIHVNEFAVERQRA